MGAAHLSEAGLETRKQMVPAGPTALITWLKLCPCNSKGRGDALRLEGENMKKEESDSIHTVAASAHPLQTPTVWSGPGLTDLQPPSEG